MSATVFIGLGLFVATCLGAAIGAFVGAKYGRKALAKHATKSDIKKIEQYKAILKDKNKTKDKVSSKTFALKMAKHFFKAAKRRCFVINKRHTIEDLTEVDRKKIKNRRNYDIATKKLALYEMAQSANKRIIKGGVIIPRKVTDENIAKLKRDKEQKATQVESAPLARNLYERKYTLAGEKEYLDQRTGMNSLSESAVDEFQDYVEANYKEPKAPYAKVAEVYYGEDSGYRPARISSPDANCYKKGLEILVKEAISTYESLAENPEKQKLVFPLTIKEADAAPFKKNLTETRIANIDVAKSFVEGKEEEKSL